MTTPARALAWPLPATPGQLQLGSLVLGPGTPYAVQQIEGLDLPPISPADSDRAGTDGSFGGIDQTLKRTLLFHMLIHPDSVGLTTNKAQLARALKGAWQEVQADTGLAYRDPDLGGLLVIGRPRRIAYTVDREYPFLSQEGVLAQFDGLDPLLYGASLNDILIPYGSAGTQAGLPFRTASFLGMTFAPQRLISNGSFEDTGLTPWNAYHDTLATDATAPPFGAANLKCTNNDTFGSFGASIDNNSMREPSANWIPGLAASGGSVTSSAYFRVSNASIRVRLYHSFGGSTDVAGPWTTLVANTWTRVTFTTQVPAGSTFMYLYVMFENYDALNNGKVGLVDGVLLEKGSVASAYTLPLMGATFDAVGGGAGAAGFATCVNNGNENFLPVSRISAIGGPVTGPLHLERVESGEVITLNYNMQSGDVLELDHDLHTVTLNSVANRGDIVDTSTSWWSMQPGSQTVHYRTDGPGAGSQAEILWRDAYW